MKQLRIIGLGGSFRPVSTSVYALRIALEFLGGRGHQVELVNLRDLKLPMYDSCDRLEDYPETVGKLLQSVRSAHAVIFSTPVYHGTISGGMKNAIDFFEFLAGDPTPYLGGKVAGLICTSGGAPGANAINTLDYICRALSAWVCPTTVTIANSHQVFDRDGNIQDTRVRDRLARLASELEFAAMRFLP